MNPFINKNTGGASNQIASLYIRKINESRMKYTREIRKKKTRETERTSIQEHDER